MLLKQRVTSLQQGSILLEMVDEFAQAGDSCCWSAVCV